MNNNKGPKTEAVSGYTDSNGRFVPDYTRAPKGQKQTISTDLFDDMLSTAIKQQTSAIEELDNLLGVENVAGVNVPVSVINDIKKTPLKYIESENVGERFKAMDTLHDLEKYEWTYFFTRDKNQIISDMARKNLNEAVFHFDAEELKKYPQDMILEIVKYHKCPGKFVKLVYQNINNTKIRQEIREIWGGFHGIPTAE